MVGVFAERPGSGTAGWRRVSGKKDFMTNQNSESETALAVDLHRVNMLAARWREKAAECRRESALTYNVDARIANRIQADAYDDCADALEAEWAGCGPTTQASAAEQPKPPLYVIGFDPGCSGGDRAAETVWRVEEGGKRLVLVRQRVMPNVAVSDKAAPGGTQ